MIGTTVDIKTHIFPDGSYYVTAICDTCGWESQFQDEIEVMDIVKHHLVHSHGMGRIMFENKETFVLPRPQ